MVVVEPPRGLAPPALAVPPLVRSAAEPAPTPPDQLAPAAYDGELGRVGRGQRHDVGARLRLRRGAHQGAQPAAQLLDVGPLARVLAQQRLDDGPQRTALLREGGRLAAHHLDQFGRVLLGVGGVALHGPVEQRAERPQVGGGADGRRELPVLVDRARLLGGPALGDGPDDGDPCLAGAFGGERGGGAPVDGGFTAAGDGVLPGGGGGALRRRARGRGRLPGAAGVGAQGVRAGAAGGHGPSGAGPVVPGAGEVDAPGGRPGALVVVLVVLVVVGALGRSAPGGGQRPGRGGGVRGGRAGTALEGQDVGGGAGAARAGVARADGTAGGAAVAHACAVVAVVALAAGARAVVAVVALVAGACATVGARAVVASDRVGALVRVSAGTGRRRRVARRGGVRRAPVPLRGLREVGRGGPGAVGLLPVLGDPGGGARPRPVGGDGPGAGGPELGGVRRARLGGRYRGVRDGGRGGARDYLLPGVGRAGAAGLLTAVVRVLVRVRGPRRPT